MDDDLVTVTEIQVTFKHRDGGVITAIYTGHLGWCDADDTSPLPSDIQATIDASWWSKIDGMDR